MWYKNCQIWPWHRWFQIGPVFLTLWVSGKTLGWPNMHTNVFSCDCNIQCKSKFYLTRYKGFSQFQVQLFVDFWRRHPAAWQSVWIPTSDGVKPEKLFDWIGHLHTFSPNLLWNMGTKCEWKGLGGRTYQRNESQGRSVSLPNVAMQGITAGHLASTGSGGVPKFNVQIVRLACCKKIVHEKSRQYLEWSPETVPSGGSWGTNFPASCKSSWPKQRGENRRGRNTWLQGSTKKGELNGYEYLTNKLQVDWMTMTISLPNFNSYFENHPTTPTIYVPTIGMTGYHPSNPLRIAGWSLQNDGFAIPSMPV